MKFDHTNWRQLANRLFAPIDFIDHSWLPKTLRHYKTVVHAAASHPLAARALRRGMAPGTDMPPVERDALRSAPGWADWPAAAQRDLIRRLGVVACAPYLRGIINRRELEVVRRSIDEDVLRLALGSRTRLVSSDLGEAFADALSANELNAFVAAVGMAVIRTTIPEQQGFLLFRLKYLFPKIAWRQPLAALHCDQEALLALLESPPEAA